MKVQILCDSPNSWIIPYAKKLQKILLEKGHEVKYCNKASQVEKGDILCLLSCEDIFKNLHLNQRNLVVHESALPQGKGWSPLTWQILEGKSSIPITLFEAEEKVDAGCIYAQEYIDFMGNELLGEMKDAQGKMTIKLIEKFVADYPDVQGVPQRGKSTYYPKRTPKDSMLDIDKSIRTQFNNLRVADNERYPAFFEKDGVKYFLKIQKAEGDSRS